MEHEKAWLVSRYGDEPEQVEIVKRTPRTVTFVEKGWNGKPHERIARLRGDQFPRGVEVTATRLEALVAARASIADKYARMQVQMLCAQGALKGFDKKFPEAKREVERSHQ